MSQEFKFKFDAMRHNNPTNPDSVEGVEKDESYTYTTARNIGFIWPDGKKQFLNYAYLIGAEYLPGVPSIILNFTSHIITLKGYNLERLFDEFMMHVPRKIVCTDLRYNATVNVDKDIIVNDITVTAV